MDNLLHYLDIAIGFAMVMLIASALVTVITQMLIGMNNYRSQILGWGIERLISQLSPKLAPYAEEISKSVLNHPLVADPSRPLVAIPANPPVSDPANPPAADQGNPSVSKPVKKDKSKAGSAIHREDFIRVLLELAQNKTLLPNDEAREALKNAIMEGLKGDPGELLKKIQTRAMELEKELPGAARYVWQAQAIVDEAGGQFVADVMAWFDQTSDRLTEVFSKKAKTVSLITALCVAGLLPLDSLELLRRLSVDNSLTAQLVAQAQKELDKVGTATASKDLKKDIETLKDLKSRIDQPGLAILPAGWWPEKVTSSKNPTDPAKLDLNKLLLTIFGVLLSAALMSLGAPFWFDMLKNLLKLRPALAANEEKDREKRATTQPEGTQNRLLSQEAGVFGKTKVAAAKDAPG
jgi:hypothetical protein